MTNLRTFLAVAALAGLATLPAAAATKAPVVVELFTSQGCSSCPPADAYLGELAKKHDVIALAFHVDYWDYIGWKDPFASAQSTDRQRAYTQALGNRYLYTPEMIVDGRNDATGSDRTSVEALIRAGHAAPSKVALSIVEKVPDKYTINIPETALKGGATVWMAVFDREHTTPVARGENSGSTLREFNIVRSMSKLARYDGTALSVPVDMSLPREKGCAILLQADHGAGDGQGPILGAALLTEN